VEQDGESRAEEERRIVRIIEQRSQQSDFFSCSLIEPIQTLSNVVVYRHAGDETGATMQSLSQVLCQLICDPKADVVDRFAREIKAMCIAAIKTYDDLWHPTYYSGIQYFNTVCARLAPDLIIDARNREIGWNGQTLDIATIDGGHPSSNPRTPPIALALDELIGKVLSEEGPETEWHIVDLIFKTIRKSPNSVFLCFSKGDQRLWLLVDQEEFSRHSGEIEIGKNVEQAYRLIFRPSIDLLLTSTSFLTQLGLDLDALLRPSEFAELCQILRAPVFARGQHTDLHCDNVLYGSDRMKIVDLGSLDYELLAVSQARLEISIWRVVSDMLELNLDPDEIEHILDNLADNVEPDKDQLSSAGWALNTVLRAVRQTLHEIDHGPALDGFGTQVALAYTEQILLQERYFIQNLHTPAHYFNQVARYWIRRLKTLIANTGMILSSREISGETSDEIAIPNTISDGPSLATLWQVALRSQILPEMEARPADFLQRIVGRQSGLLSKSLTELQNAFLEAAQKDNPFQSNQHVIIAGPTSSGKSTVAEMFLAVPALINDGRRCAIYVAPTRALTQAKYRELRERFASDEVMSNGVVLSTGEDSDDDWRITHCRFTIACMVYEKANILFSQNRKLLNRLGCIVVDEFHMLTNLERGPILETMLAKALDERASIDSQAQRVVKRDTIKIVVISTEDCPDQTLIDFLSARNPITTMPIQPLVIHALQRPVPVQHVLVLNNSERNKGKSVPTYIEVPIVEFTSTEQRLLSPQELAKLNQKLTNLWNNRSPRQTTMRRDSKNNMYQRLHDLLFKILQQHRYGHRVLVFVPSRREAEDQARRLKNILQKMLEPTQPNRRVSLEVKYDAIVKRLKPHLDGAEDSRMAQVVRECAKHGVLIHHSDIDKKIRLEIENICANITTDEPSQVIFATETLSYGVNLAVQDVILFGTEFNASTRFGEPRPEALSGCSYHNMAGRAGRLGKTDSSATAHVYIIIHPEENGFQIVKDYYWQIDTAESKLYTVDDRAVQSDMESNPFVVFGDVTDPCAPYITLGAQDFSYPLVRAILDSLRHKNLEGRRINSVVRTAVSSEQLLDFLRRTLYVRQFISDKPNPADRKREQQLFRCALQRILDDCARDTLKLVDKNNNFYAITARGEAIIDTGTEISTIEPLLGISKAVRDIWRESSIHGSFPTHIYVLCLIAQYEIFREYIYYMPECRTSEAKRVWSRQLQQENRAHVFGQFVTWLERISDIPLESLQDFATVLRDWLDTDWKPLQRVNASYQYGATDSLLRLFNGIAAWINGEEREIVDQLMEGTDNLKPGYQGVMQGFRHFADLLNIKTLFLSRMLATSKAEDISLSADDERKLHQLANCLRLGCTAEAIPLFWPFSSDFRRREAAKLLNAKITPSRLLSLSEPLKLTQVDIMPSKVERLRDDLERYAKKEFQELQDELVEEHPNDQKRERVRNLLLIVGEQFEASVKLFRDDRGAPLPFDTMLREQLDFRNLVAEDGQKLLPILNVLGNSAVDDRVRISVDIPTRVAGIHWNFERAVRISNPERSDRKSTGSKMREGRYEREKFAHIFGLQFRRGWKCSDGNKFDSFASFLKRHEKTQHLFIVALPWYPLSTELPNDAVQLLTTRSDTLNYTTTIFTIAAFATLVTALARDFLNSEKCMEILFQATPKRALFNIISIREVQVAIDSMPDRQIPLPIREKLIRHFEVVS
jgi:superfamily II DNA/RNA helicase